MLEGVPTGKLMLRCLDTTTNLSVFFCLPHLVLHDRLLRNELLLVKYFQHIFPFSFSMKEIDARVVQEDPSIVCSVKCEYDIMQHFQN